MTEVESRAGLAVEQCVDTTSADLSVACSVGDGMMTGDKEEAGRIQGCGADKLGLKDHVLGWQTMEGTM